LQPKKPIIGKRRGLVSSPEVVIVGAGLAGLSAAALLVKDGIRVVLIEEDEDVGGKLRSIEREGFCMDGGLHCFHYGDDGPIGELCRALSLDISYLESRNASYILRGNKMLAVPQKSDNGDPDAPAFTTEEASRIHAWFERLMEADHEEWNKKSLAEFIKDKGLEEDETVGAYATAQCLTVLGRSREEVSAGLIAGHSRAVGHPGFRVSVIQGGPAKLINALSERISRDHARLVLGGRVLDVQIDGQQATRVTTGSEEFLPEAVIYTGPPQKLPEIIYGEEKAMAPFYRKCGLVPVSGISVEMGLDASISDIQGVMIDPEEAVIGRFPSNLDPDLAPQGCQISSWLALLSPDDLEDVKATRLQIRRLKRVIRRLFPQMADHVKWERLRVIPVISAAAPLPSQMDGARPPVRIREVKNFFIAGDGTAGKGILSGRAVDSAMEAAQRVKNLLGRD
jgi:phytoene dehydrogenase-like protein